MNADKARKGRAARESESARSDAGDVASGAGGAAAEKDSAPSADAAGDEKPEDEKENEDAEEKAGGACASSHVHADRRKKKRETPGEVITLLDDYITTLHNCTCDLTVYYKYSVHMTAQLEYLSLIEDSAVESRSCVAAVCVRWR